MYYFLFYFFSINASHSGRISKASHKALLHPESVPVPESEWYSFRGERLPLLLYSLLKIRFLKEINSSSRIKSVFKPYRVNLFWAVLFLCEEEVTVVVSMLKNGGRNMEVYLP